MGAWRQSSPACALGVGFLAPALCVLTGAGAVSKLAPLPGPRRAFQHIHCLLRVSVCQVCHELSTRLPAACCGHFKAALTRHTWQWLWCTRVCPSAQGCIVMWLHVLGLQVGGWGRSGTDWSSGSLSWPLRLAFVRRWHADSPRFQARTSTRTRALAMLAQIHRRLARMLQRRGTEAPSAAAPLRARG